MTMLGAPCSNCCAWYCCEDRIAQCRDRLGDALKLTATISAQDYKKQDLVTGCFCSFPQSGNDRWISGTYLWPGSIYAGTFELTPRRNPQFIFPSTTEVGIWWTYEYIFPPDEAGCTGSRISVDVQVRVPGDILQVTPSTRLQINAMALTARFYTYLKSGRGTPDPETKSLSEMKCDFQAFGSASACTGTRETYSTGLATLSAFGQSVFLGDCVIATPDQISGSGTVGSLGATSCGEFGVGSLISETGSLAYSMTLNIEQT